MDYNQQQLEVSDFSGGKTDNYINCPINQGQNFDNVLILNNKTLFSRNGILLYDSTNYQIPAGNQKISEFIKHPSGQLFVQSARNLYYIASGSFNTLTGPVDSNPAFSINTTSNYISQAVWRNHVYLTSDSYADPIKVFKNSAGTYQVRTAGMPEIELEGAIDLAVSITSKYNAHIINTPEHTVAADTVNGISAPTPYDFNSLIVWITDFITKYTLHEADAAKTSAWSYHAGTETGSHSLASSTVPTTLAEALTFLDDIKTKFNAHDADDSAHGTNSENQVSAVRVPAFTAGGSGSHYLYAFFYKYTYTVGDVTFENDGPVFYSADQSLNTSTKTISNIPAIANGSTRCYDTATITCEIYRTVASGSTYYRVGSVTNGTTSYSDTTSDSDLILNSVLYTEGDVLEDEPPPPCKYISIVNDVACYAAIKEGSVAYPTRFRFSRPGSPDATSVDFDDDVEEDITGINNLGIYHILFTRNRVYRLEGFFDELGRGGIEKREISREHGCISNRSIVRTPEGLYYAGTDGFYFTDGYTVKKISAHLNPSYKNIVVSTSQEAGITGRFDASEKRIYWAVTSNVVLQNNDSFWVLDLTFPGVAEDQKVFTTFSNNNSWQPTAIEYLDGDILIGDSRGYVFRFDDNTIVDYKVDTTVAPSSWNTSTIIWDYKSFSTTFGSVTQFKFVPTCTLQAKNLGNATIQIKSNEEDSNNYAALKEIRVRDSLIWGEAGYTWGASDVLWNVQKLVRAMRRFPFRHVRSIYKQIQITNSKTIIYNSDTYGTGNIDGSANTLTIAGTFPTDIVTYVVTFENDSYTQEYTISTRNSGTVLTFLDPSNVAPTSTGKKWLIKGYRKKERLNLLSFSLNYLTIAQNQSVYTGSTGANA